MLITLFGMVMLVRRLQLWNAYSPMLVTLFGMVILVRLLQLWNAPLFNPVRTRYKYNIIF